MTDTRIAPSPAHPARMKLEPYSAEIRLSNLTLGVDNIHYDVFLSPRFVDFTRKYLLDLVRQKMNISAFYGKDRKHSGAPEHGAFRKLLTEVLQASLTRAKFQQPIETDILHQLALVKHLTSEITSQFSSIVVESKEWIRARGELFEHSEQAHVMRTKRIRIAKWATRCAASGGKWKRVRFRNRGGRFSARISTTRTSCCRTVFFLWRTGTTIICSWNTMSCWQIS